MKIRNSAINSTAAALLLAVGATAAHGAADQTADLGARSTHSVVVHYAHDSLDQAAGERALYERLEAAARTACGPVDIKSFYARRLWKECYEAALAGALAQLGTQRVAASRE